MEQKQDEILDRAAVEAFRAHLLLEQLVEDHQIAEPPCACVVNMGVRGQECIVQLCIRHAEWLLL